MSRRAVPPVRYSGEAARTVVVAWLRASVVVAGQIAVLAGFLWLSVRTSSDGYPDVVAWLPVVGFTGWLLITAREQYRRAGRENPTWMGYLLVAAAPFTAFGGGCTVDGPLPPGARLLQSGVRIGVELGAGACQTYLNGALLVLGYALLAVGLLLDERGFGRVAERFLG